MVTHYEIRMSLTLKLKSKIKVIRRRIKKEKNTKSTIHLPTVEAEHLKQYTCKYFRTKALICGRNILYDK